MYNDVYYTMNVHNKRMCISQVYLNDFNDIFQITVELCVYHVSLLHTNNNKK